MLGPGGGLAAVRASREADGRRAVAAAIRAVRDVAGDGAGLLVAAVGHDPRALLRGVADADAELARTLVAVTQGLVVDDDVLDGPAVAVLAVPRAFAAEAAWLVDPLSRRAGVRVARPWRGAIALGPAPDELAGALAPLAARGIAWAGAVGAPGTPVIVGDELGLAPAALLMGAGGVAVAAAPGVALIGPVLAITDGVGHEIHALDGHRALDALRLAGGTSVGALLAADAPRVAQGLFVAIAADPGALEVPGEAPLLGIAAVDPDRGWLGLTGSAPLGAHARLAIPDGGAAFAALRGATARARAGATGAPACALWLASAARAGDPGTPGSLPGGASAAARDAIFLRGELGVPLLGLLGAAELFPGPGGPTPTIHGGVLALVHA